jgi:hypothetical protein
MAICECQLINWKGELEIGDVSAGIQGGTVPRYSVHARGDIQCAFSSKDFEVGYRTGTQQDASLLYISL